MGKLEEKKADLLDDLLASYKDMTVVEIKAFLDDAKQQVHDVELREYFRAQKELRDSLNVQS
jgi:hypothetical protein